MNPETSEVRTEANARPPQILLSRLIDYAGLFPPAALDMPEAVTNYASYLRSEHSWMLGRFIVPAARLSEFEEALGQLPIANSKPWGLSVLLGTNPAADVARIVAFNAKTPRSANGRHAVVESVEARAETPEDVERLAAIVPRQLAAYFEIPLAGSERECISAVAECGRSAKIRTGGETADKFPEPARLVEFMRLCAHAKASFKATAGLHHPIRAIHRLTYRPDSPSALMYGFLNVFLAAAFLRAGMEPISAIELLEEQSAEAFRFDSGAVTWREHRLRKEDIARARHEFSISFGSCSFTEPVDDLRSLGLL